MVTSGQESRGTGSATATRSQETKFPSRGTFPSLLKWHLRTALLFAQESAGLPAQGTRTALHQGKEAGARLSSPVTPAQSWELSSSGWKRGGVIVLKLCGKFIENLGVFRKRLKNCDASVPASRASLETAQPSRDPLAGAERRGSQSGHASGEELCVSALPWR